MARSRSVFGGLAFAGACGAELISLLDSEDLAYGSDSLVHDTEFPSKYLPWTSLSA